MQTTPLSRNFIAGASKVRELIDEGAVTMVLPARGHAAGRQGLGLRGARLRGRFQDLPESPVELFASRRRRSDPRYRPS